MSLTIEQILEESREESNSPQTFNFEKESSAQPSVSLSDNFSSKEIEKMAGLLREAEVSTEVVTPTPVISMNEKIAEALILSQTLQAINAVNNPVEVDPEQEKLAMWRDKAINAGYDTKEVDAFLEKQARMNMMGALKSPIGKGLMATMALGGAGAAGHEIGETRTERKAKKVIKHVGRHAYNTGLKRGFGAGMRSGFSRGATASTQYHRRKLREMSSGRRVAK